MILTTPKLQPQFLSSLITRKPTTSIPTGKEDGAFRAFGCSQNPARGLRLKAKVQNTFS
jgi:hypothetical protein